MSNEKNYLATLNAARMANRQQDTTLDIEKAMSEIKRHSDNLSVFDKEELKEVDELLDKLDSLAGIFDKYGKIQGKIETLKENAALIESSLSDLVDIAETADIDPFKGYTQDETYAINVQLIKEFEDGTRLAKDLLELSVEQVLDEDVPDEVPAFSGLTKEQTVQVYMQVMDEFDRVSPLSSILAYNAGVK